jgi:hypothetical protein
MSRKAQEKLYSLMPAIYRLRDSAQGQPLRALLAVIDRERRLLEDDISGLYENWFIETCSEWVVPYIGDLLGVRNLHPVDGGIFSQRPYVANTLAYRRRKGTASVLEQLARDVTGWPAKAVEFFELLGSTQYMKHLRPGKGGTVNLRNAGGLELINTPFDGMAHTVDVRHIDNGRGRYGISHVGIFLWRLESYPIERGTPLAVTSPADGRYAIHPLGLDVPLFNVPQTETGITHPAEEVNVPAPLRRRPLYEELEARRNALVQGAGPAAVYFGSVPAFEVYIDNRLLQPEELAICNLADWNRPVSQTFTQPNGIPFQTRAAIDPVLGRLAILDGSTPATVEVSSAYGFSGNWGNGPYDRRPQASQEAEETIADTLSNPDLLGLRLNVPSDYASIEAALAVWNSAENKLKPAVIHIENSTSHSLTGGVLTIDMTGGPLVLQAANTDRAVLLGDVVVTGGDGKAKLTLSGLLISGSLRVDGDLAELNLYHSTVAVGSPLSDHRISVESSNYPLQAKIDHCICGPLRMPDDLVTLTIRDSIVDAPSLNTQALISGPLDPFSVLTSGAPQLMISINGEGPYPVSPANKPATLEEARQELEAAIHKASATPAFKMARVEVADHRLIILADSPSDPITITCAAAEGVTDPSAMELKLASGTARQVTGLLSGRLPASLEFSNPAPAVNIQIGSVGFVQVKLSSPPASADQAAVVLQTALRAADPAPEFSAAHVLCLDHRRLLVLPGVEHTEARVESAPNDKSSVLELGMITESLAVAAADRGELPGPPATIIRSTVMGGVRVRELDLASETIFTGLVLSERHQSGCVRFCFVPNGSRTPRRYRCQPDYALYQRARQLGLPIDTPLPSSEQQHILTRLQPVFTDTRYGRPAYGQLAWNCPEEIMTGAEDGSEMGVFCSLKNKQRLANLQATLEEYLRYGLEAGLFFAG